MVQSFWNVIVKSATVENGWICNVVLLSYVKFPALCNIPSVM